MMQNSLTIRRCPQCRNLVRRRFGKTQCCRRRCETHHHSLCAGGHERNVHMPKAQLHDCIRGTRNTGREKSKIGANTSPRHNGVALSGFNVQVFDELAQCCFGHGVRDSPRICIEPHMRQVLVAAHGCRTINCGLAKFEIKRQKFFIHSYLFRDRFLERLLRTDRTGRTDRDRFVLAARFPPRSFPTLI